MIPWDPALETGIVEIDDQHQLLFRKAGFVLDAVAAGQGPFEVGRALDFLLDYAAEHFGTEERYMRLSGYPELEAHIQAHQALTERLKTCADAFAAQGATAALVTDIEALVRGWLSEHIRKNDRRLATFLSVMGA
jgi:hemerythrin-like metal-binding protein